MKKKLKKTKSAIGTKFFKEGTQNQQILAKFWGNGKTFTMDDLRSDMHIASPGARISELKEAGFNVKSSTSDDNFGAVGRPVSAYSIPRRRVSA
jgi:response regulator of citrate/malate metabolism